MGVWGIAPENFRNLTCKSVHFDAFLRLSQTLNLMQHVSSNFGNLRGVRRLF